MSASPKTQINQAIAEMIEVTNTLIAERNDARMNRDAAMENVNALTRENARRVEIIAELRRGTNAQTEQIERLLVAKNALEGKVEALKHAENAPYRRNLFDEIDKLTKKIAGLETELTRAKEQVEAYRKGTAAKEASATIAQRDLDITAQRDRIAELKRKLGEERATSADFQRANAVLLTEVHDLKKENAGLKQVDDMRRAHVDRMQNALDGIQYACANV